MWGDYQRHQFKNIFMQKLSKSPTKNKLHYKIKHTIKKIISYLHLSSDVLKCVLPTDISIGQNEEFLL